MPINASIAVLAADSALAQAVANRISGHQVFSVPPIISDTQADQSTTFGECINLSAVPAMPNTFDPPQLGSFLGWGADIALLVVDSSLGLDGESIQRSQEVAQHHPLMVAVTGLNSPRANFDETLAVISRVMGQGHQVVAITLPVLQESDSIDESVVGGILDLVDLEIRVPSPDGGATKHELEQAHYDVIEGHVEALANAVVVTSTDEELIHAVLQDGFESVEQLRQELLRATARRELIPVFALAESIGVTELADFACELNIETWTPIPAHVDDLLGTSIGDNLIRMWHGELRTGRYCADKIDIDITRIYSMSGTHKTSARAGEIVKIDANREIATGSTISASGSNPLVVDHVFE